MTVQFDIRQHAEVGKYIGERLDKAIRKAVLSTAHRIVAHIKTELIPAEQRIPVDRGVYKASWKAQKTTFGAEVFNTTPYASIIEHGVPAGNVRVGRKMLAALADWARRKGLVATKRAAPGKLSKDGTHTKVRWVNRGNVDIAADARAVAWAIAMSLKKRGIFNGGKGLRILERALDKVDEFIVEEVVREVARIGD